MHTCVLKEKWGQYRIPIIIDDFFTTAKKNLTDVHKIDNENKWLKPLFKEKSLFQRQYNFCHFFVWGWGVKSIKYFWNTKKNHDSEAIHII